MVILLDKNKRPLGFTTEKRLHKLCEAKRAVMYRVFPSVAIVKDTDSREFADLQSYRVKIDPGAKHTGLAVVCNETDQVMLYIQIEHRGEAVKSNLDTKRGARRNRRGRETRYRRCKFKKGILIDSPREKGWLPPSVKSTADNIINWVRRLSRWINITKCSFEAVRFDTQLMDDPDIKGVEYQQGTLFGYELREYLLDRYGHTCQYCGGTSGDPVLEWEHIVPKSRGGSDSVKNATLSCGKCNREKGNMLLSEWTKVINGKAFRTELDKARLDGIKAVSEGKTKGVSDRYCAWTNATRKYTERFLFEIFNDVECTSGGKTKYNRTQVLHLPKDHHYDALCVGTVPDSGYKDRTNGYVLYAKAKGRGSRLRGTLNACGIITTKWYDNKRRYDTFQTGDIVSADIPTGKYKGHHTGMLYTRARDSWCIKPFAGKQFDVNKKYVRLKQHKDGYVYQFEQA